jgi:hypothetical protein
MVQDYRLLSADQHELVEKQTLRTLVQAMQDYSKEGRQLFEYTPATSETEVIVLAEDIVQYALEVAECYPINRRFAGFIDYKRVRWLPTPFGLLPQALLVDAKASTENNRSSLQRSQLPMDADFRAKMGGSEVEIHLAAGFDPHLPVAADAAGELAAVTTTALIHFHHRALSKEGPRFRELLSIFIMLVPHARLKPKYNPSAANTFFGRGKDAPTLGEDPRIRIYFSRLRQACPWRLQELRYADAAGYTMPVWQNSDAPLASPKDKPPQPDPFLFLGR